MTWPARNFFCSVNTILRIVLVGRTKHPTDWQTSIGVPTSILSSVERWLKIASGAQSCNGAYKFLGTS